MNLSAVWRREIFSLRGRNAEKALQRLKNGGIDLFDVKKVKKDVFTFCVTGKQGQKVFAFYPKTWYNNTERGGYEVTSLGKKGVGEALCRTGKRAGIWAGAAAFVLFTAFCDEFVFDVKYSGDSAACAVAAEVAAKYGVKAFSRFDEEAAEKIAAEILSTDGVSYAAVRKRGTVVYVEARRSPFAKQCVREGDMRAERTGTLRDLTVLRGQIGCKAGDLVRTGDVLVFAASISENGEKTTVTVSARAEIACVYEAIVRAESEKEAAAIAEFLLFCDGEAIERQSGLAEATDRLRAGSVAENVTVESVRAEKTGDGQYAVRVEYVAAEVWNF